jgi:hypothetical protein
VAVDAIAEAAVVVVETAAAVVAAVDATVADRQP